MSTQNSLIMLIENISYLFAQFEVDCSREPARVAILVKLLLAAKELASMINIRSKQSVSSYESQVISSMSCS